MSYGSEGWSDYYGEGAPWMPGDGIGDMGALGAGDRGVVVAPSGLNLRAQPLPTAPIVAAIGRGTVVEILGEGGVPVDDTSAPYRGAPWFMVTTAGQGGWVSAEYVMSGCENRTALGAYVAAARVEAQVKGALAGALLGGAAVFLFMVTRAPK